MSIVRMSTFKRPLAFVLLSFSGASHAINSAVITAAAVSPQCIEYKVVGICYWLFCTPFGCKVRTSAKVRHFIPEAVVSSYGNTGQNPWVEVSPLSAPNATAASGGNATTNHNNENATAIFKNVDVVGHPGTLLSKAASSTGYVCASGAMPYVPYFLSTLDSAAWRNGIPEVAYPQSLIPGVREVGSLLRGSNWGSVYPREGFLNQTDDYKAAAVMAQRAADVVTRVGQVHVYMPIRSLPQQGYWPPGPVMEGDITTHKWQELAPTVSPTCAVFPQENFDLLSVDGSYAWALWRPYSCCERKGQVFLGSTDFQ
ncbi:hypothetical protein ALO41_200160 [Pseudomonas amygdali pv. ulmi]|uniref:Uncharacterized protein n=2 Tax=Pseudomonas syringae group TaxID=136849 RepID=A0A0Q0EEM5_PSEA0|nr:hypothetical protein ALO41_200160 [Pseudomonas amygdali pv. ulmi]KWS16872.1 conjugal transfer protein [Pseudomonas amygdali pv. ulmi]